MTQNIVSWHTVQPMHAHVADKTVSWNTPHHPLLPRASGIYSCIKFRQWKIHQESFALALNRLAYPDDLYR